MIVYLEQSKVLSKNKGIKTIIFIFRHKKLEQMKQVLVRESFKFGTKINELKLDFFDI